MPRTLGDARHETLIAFLIARRKEARLTQAELAARMKVFQSYVARMESGERRIDVIEFIKLGEVLGFDPSEAIRVVVSGEKT
jgi:transcriptional regulator with XRE-family HTH domain